jgi:hypothetical protein
MQMGWIKHGECILKFIWRHFENSQRDQDDDNEKVSSVNRP